MEPAALADPSDHTLQNLDWWRRRSEDYQMMHAEQLPTGEATWAVFSIPEAELGVLGDVAGKDVVELGAGGAQFSLGLARAGARCTAIDNSPEQLACAAALVDEVEATDGVRPEVTLQLADVEATGLPGASFDIAFSDYGASMFADPLRWVPEAARLLRPGGRLAFSLITPMLETCWEVPKPVSNRFVKDYFGMHRIEGESVLFNLPYGDWVRLFRRSGFTIVDLVETRPAPGVEATTYRSANQVAWARRWPAEMIWVLDRD